MFEPLEASGRRCSRATACVVLVATAAPCASADGAVTDVPSTVVLDGVAVSVEHGEKSPTPRLADRGKATGTLVLRRP